MWKNRLTAWLRPVLTLFVLAGLLSLAACGGGNGAPNNPYTSGGNVALSVLPTITTVYSGVPATLTISGGSAPYRAFSSNSAVLPVPLVPDTTIPLLASSVASDVSVTITIQDAAGTSATATVTVKPSLLLPSSITITGNPICGPSGSTLCSGQDGTASVLVTGPTGGPLAGRQVRFDVVLGTFSLVSVNSAVPAQTQTVVSDQNGLAAVTIRVPVTAVTQFATIRATDVISGSSVVGQFTIAQFVSGAGILSIIPAGVTTFTGPSTAECASGPGVQANFYIFGGTPPYTVKTNFPTAVSLTGVPVLVSGGGFAVIPNGTCFTGLTFAITDSAGRTLLTPPTVDNVLGTAAPASPAINVNPANFGTPTSRVDCSGSPGFSFSFLITGGTPPFTAASSTPGVVFTPNTVTASPGTLTGHVDATTATDVKIVIGDTSKPQKVSTQTIYCQ